MNGKWIDITKIIIHPELTQTYNVLSFSGSLSYLTNNIFP
jgi:hypothetical protein